MCCKNWKSILPFALTFLIGIFGASILQNNFYSSKKISGVEYNISSLKIISKEKALYTEAARKNQIQGIVTLRVVFQANGEIGSITPINTLSDDLTEQAIIAAKGIKFEPQKVNGVPQNVVKLVQYNFTLY